MISALLVALILSLPLCVLSSYLLLKHCVSSAKADLASQLRAFVESPSETEPSPMAVLADQIALLFAARVWQQVETRLRGAAGNQGKEDLKEGEAQVAASSPWAALAMAFLPKKYKNMLAVNPQFVGQLAGMVGQGGSPSAAGGGDGQKSDVQKRMSMGG